MTDATIQREGDLKLAREIVIRTFTERFEQLRVMSDIEVTINAEAGSLRNYLLNCDSRTYCILAVSFVEDALKQVFTHYWGISGRKLADQYFGSNGPLNTFSQRSLVASAIGWITDDDRHQLDALRKIRNAFAHDHRVLTLDNPSMVKLLGVLREDEPAYSIPRYVLAVAKAPFELLARLRVYKASTFIIARMLSRAKLAKAEIPPEFRPGTAFKDFTNVEQAFIDHMIHHSFELLGADDEPSDA